MVEAVIQFMVSERLLHVYSLALLALFWLLVCSVATTLYYRCMAVTSSSDSNLSILVVYTGSQLASFVAMTLRVCSLNEHLSERS